MKGITKNEKGASLPIILITLLVLSIFAVTIVSLNTTNYKVAAREESRIEAYYLARTGAETFSQYVVQNPDDKKNVKEFMEDFKGETSLPTAFGDGEFEIEIIESKLGYKIKSTGRVKNVEESIIVTVAPTDIESIFEERSILSLNEDNKMEIGEYKNDRKINGLIQTNAKEIEFKGGDEDKKKTGYQTNAKISNLKTPSIPKYDFQDITEEYDKGIIKYDKGNTETSNEIKDGKNNTINKSDEYKKIKTENLEINNQKGENIKLKVKDGIEIKEEGILEIVALENQTIEIHASSLKLEKGSRLDIKGMGTVKIIIDGEIETKKGCTVNIGDKETSRKEVYIQGKKIKIGDKSITNITNNKNIRLVATNGEIKIGEGDDKIKSNLNIENNESVRFLAPKGKIEFKENSEVKIKEVDDICFYSKEIEIGDDSKKRALSFKIKGVEDIRFIAPEDEIEIEDNVDMVIEGKSNIYFQGDEIEIGKNVNILAKDSSKIFFLLEGNKDDDDGEFEIEKSSSLLTEGVDEKGNKTSHIFVIMTGDGEIEIEENVKFHGYIYAPNAKLEVDKNVDLEGSFIANKVKIKEGVNLIHKYPRKEDMNDLSERSSIIINSIINTTNTYKVLQWEDGGANNVK